MLLRKVTDHHAYLKKAVLATTLSRAWVLVGEWAAAYVDAQPRASADDLAQAIVAIDPPRDCQYN